VETIAAEEDAAAHDRHTAVEGKLSDREMCPLTPFRWWP
jgi:hypothetical protein